VSVTAMSGTPQSHEVNEAFAAPLVATVTTNGLPTSGVVVTFRAPATGASGTFADTATGTTTATTDPSGLATSAAFHANGTPGGYTVTASAPGAPLLASFSLANTTGAPAAIVVAKNSNGQTAVINTPFAQQFTVTVEDNAGNPVGSAIVVFAAPTTGASGTFANGQHTESDTTNSSGVATSSAFTANGATGAYAVSAAVGGISTNINLTNSAGAPASITATSGTPQTAQTGTPFSAPLAATVFDGSNPPNPVSGAAVTFSAPTASGSPSGTFSNGTATETDTTNANGVATSSMFTANGVLGPYVVTATVQGVSPAANFSLTNRVAANTYVFSLSGQEATIGPNYYALAGSVLIDSQGNVVGGEQDYNDGEGNASPQPQGDAIAGGSLSVDATGQGTLTLTTNNTSLPNAGTEILGVQFVNSNHALIIEFDGIATSSGSMDFQTPSSSLSGGYAFTLSGVDPFYQPIGFGGVFTISGGTTLQNGLFDTNDSGTVTIGTALSGTLSTPDSLGRGSITGFSYPFSGTPQSVSFNYYVVGPEVIRIIDVDSTSTSGVSANDSAIGSAFGQGSNASGATNATLGNSVFGIAGSPFPSSYAAVGMFSTSNTSSSPADFSGIADDNELTNGLQLSPSSISGTYSIMPNGYGSLTIASGLGDVSVFGIYMTDPNLNLLDPNNTTPGSGGGGLIADMDLILAGGTGILIPQPPVSVSSFTGNYAFGAQGFNTFPEEFDFVGQGSVTSGTLSGTGLVSDPFITFGANGTNSGVTFSGTPLPDTSNVGRYTMFSTVPNPLEVTINGTATPLDVVIYQASGGQLLWLNEDASTVFLGSLQQQGSLTGLPAARKPAVKTKSNQKQKD